MHKYQGEAFYRNAEILYDTPDNPCVVCHNGAFWGLMLMDRFYSICQNYSCYEMVLMMPVLFDSREPTDAEIREYDRNKGAEID